MLFVERAARRRKTLRESIGIPLRKQPRPCPRLRASIYRRWYPRDLLSPFFFCFSFQKKLFSSLSASSSSSLPLPSPRRHLSSSPLIFSHLLSSRESPCYRRPSSCVCQRVLIMRACQFHLHAPGKSRSPHMCVCGVGGTGLLWSLIDYIVR